MQTDQERRIDATPTKEFFISMLVRDIELMKAITDLVDNSVDGARRLREDQPLSGLYVHLTVDADRFEIVDNCGGIDVAVARDYAFRFGRPANIHGTPHSVGQFGIGMKRALFKLGRQFRVSSTTQNSHFVLEVDVANWQKESPSASFEESWSFSFTDLNEFDAPIPVTSTGTTIAIDDLVPEVATEMELKDFPFRLLEELQTAHQDSLKQGLEIHVNGVAAKAPDRRLLGGPDLKPAYVIQSLNGRGAPVTTKIYVGVTSSSPETAGWDVICNGRVVLASDRTDDTGWGEGGGNTIPRYHNQFARFRGYVFFDSYDAGRLPWNTTKTGVDRNSAVYRSTRQAMVNAMRPVIRFLNQLDKEISSEHTPTPCLDAIDDAKLVDLNNIPANPLFAGPSPTKAQRGPREARIAYGRPQSQVEKVKLVLRVSSNKAVGEATFDYFYQAECEE